MKSHRSIHREIWLYICVFQGEPGATGYEEFKKAEDGIKYFEKKFKDKTKNDWSKRDNFQAKPGKYTLLDIGMELIIINCLPWFFIKINFKLYIIFVYWFCMEFRHISKDQ